jgi:mono/diheme cytochrome c family protein
VQAIRHGIRPPTGALGRSMPAFAELSEAELSALVRFLRGRFSTRPAWKM